MVENSQVKNLALRKFFVQPMHTAPLLMRFFADSSIQKINSAAAIRFKWSPYTASASQGSTTTPVAYARMNDNERFI
jgi:hypothetical protein